MSAAALHGANFGALAWTLLCLIVGLTIAAFCIVSGNRDRRAKRKAHAGPLPRATFENFREPMRDEWGNPHSGVSDDELERQFAMDAREPRR